MHSLYKNEYRIFKLVEATIKREVSRKKIEDMNEFRIYYIYTYIYIYMYICIYTHMQTHTYKWKCCKENPSVAILNKQKCHFFLHL
jgi:hypothetical protein